MSRYSSTNPSIRQRGLPFGLLLTYFILQATSVRGVRFVSLPHNLARDYTDEYESEFTFDRSSYFSPGLFYGSCESINENNLERNCTLAMETSSNMDSLEHLRFCNFTIKLNRGDELIAQSLQAIDKDKAVWALYNADPRHPNMSIIHFSDCRLVPVNLGNIEFTSIQPALDDVFHVTYDYDGIHYRTVINFEGNIVTSPQRDWLYKPRAVITVFSPMKERLVVDESTRRGVGGVIRVTKVNDEGSIEVLKEYPYRNREEGYTWLQKFTVSSSHELLSVCTEKNSTIYCGQFDWNGVLKFETNFSLAHYSAEYVSKIYNIPGGGLIILIFKCSPKNFDFSLYCSKRAGDYHIVKKFDGTGRYTGSLQLWNFSAKDGKAANDLHFFMNSENEMCLSAIDETNFHSQGQVTLNVACFKDEDFFL